MKKIYFKGYYGNKNLGDDIFTITAEYICENYWKEYNPIFIGQSLPKLSKKSKSIAVKNNHIRRLCEIFILMCSSNIIYFGGSLFSNGGKTIKDLKYLIRKSVYLQNKASAFGVSLGPFLNQEDLISTQELLKGFNYVGVRDYSSVDVLDNMKLRNSTGFSFDIAILLSDVYPDLVIKNKGNKSLTIGVNLTRNDSEFGRNLEAERKREKTLINTLNRLIETNKQIKQLVFIEFNGNESNGDSKVTDEFYNLFRKKIETKKVQYTQDTKNMLDRISDCDFILGTRLHSGIIAYSLDIPFMLIEYHNKCTEFLNTINHNYRYNANDYEVNVQNINHLIQVGKNPNMKDFHFFKQILRDEIQKLYSLL